MTTLDDIRDFLHQVGGVKKEEICENSDLAFDLGIEGDDWDDLLREYQGRFRVNLDGFLWYFHHGEEGFDPLWLFVRQPNRRVAHIPVTPLVLLESAQIGRWSVVYPQHKLPPGRPDLTAWWVMEGVSAIGRLFRRSTKEKV